MTARQAWLLTALIGMVMGAVGLYFGYFTMAAAVGTVLLAALGTRRLSGAAGGVTGLAIGAGALLWIGSICPARTLCRAEFPIELVSAALASALATGVALTVIAWARERSR